MKKLIATIAILLAGTPALAERPSLDFRLGLDYLGSDQSDINALNGLSVFYVSRQGFYAGPSLYSAALGTGGGFFVGGWEVGKRTALTDALYWDVSFFVGGGGGATQVTGDGLMLRPQVHLGYDFGDYRIGIGVSGISVSGSEISTPAFSLSLTRPLNLELESGHPETGTLVGATKILALTPLVRNYFPISSAKTNGEALQPMHLLGAELTFGQQSDRETFIQASGVVYGDAEGYADWVLGQRYFWVLTPFKFYTDAGAGIGGGGAVNTGGGLIVAANIGAQIDVSDWLVLGVGVGAISALNGDFYAITPTLKASLVFGSGNTATPSAVRWQLGTGVTQLLTTSDFRKPGVTGTGSPALIYADLDVFLTNDLYLTGHAYTAATGDAGGFQIGLVGLGYTLPLTDKLSLSAEFLLGSAAGAGINAQGGLVGGAKIEADYHLNDSVSLSFGLGQIQTLQGGGMHPAAVSLGLKFPITTWH